MQIKSFFTIPPNLRLLFYRAERHKTFLKGDRFKSTPACGRANRKYRSP